jgi:CubicO group peptidase (beta-lactamase class C family)
MAYSSVFGLASLEHEVPITERTSFYIASTAKQFTAAGIWLLALRGKLGIDDPVRRYLPELPDYGTPITLRHLLHHTSGLRDYIDLLQLAGEPPERVGTHEDLLALVYRQKGLNFRPGTAHQYANTNYVLLAEVVARASGQSYADFLNASFFAPLEMTGTRVDAGTGVVPGRATAYASAGQGKGFTAVRAPSMRLGAAGIYSNVADLLRWDAAFWSGRVGGRALADSMAKPGVLADGRRIDYASGLMLGHHRGLATIRHGGNSSGFRAELLRFPEQALTVVALCNRNSPRAPELAERVAELFLRDLAAPADPVAAPAATPPGTSLGAREVAGALGDYWNPATGEVRTLAVRNGRPVYQIDAWSRAWLTPAGPARFRFGNNEITVSGPAGSRRLELVWYDGRRERYEELRRVRPAASVMRRYGGMFHAAEIGAAYTIVPQDSALRLERPGQEPRLLLPTAPDEFSEGTVRLRFTRGGSGGVNGFIFADGEVNGLAFLRIGAAL